MFARLFRVAFFLSLVFSSIAFAADLKDPRLEGSYRFDRAGWTYVHLQGEPEQLGFQHGYLLAPQIADMFQVLKVESEHSTRRN